MGLFAYVCRLGLIVTAGSLSSLCPMSGPQKSTRRFALASGGCVTASQDACCLNACTEGRLVLCWVFSCMAGFFSTYENPKGEASGRQQVNLLDMHMVHAFTQQEQVYTQVLTVD